MKPLAYRLRPKTLEEVIGQDHLCGIDGVITNMIRQDKLKSFVLYGEPGTGKTTIAKIIKSIYELNAYEFNASSDGKQILKDISDLTKYHDNVILIIDEIHRMKKDVQDYLLPFIEDGRIIAIGLTTSNPYIAINKAIRSRLTIYKMNTIKKGDIVSLLNKTIKMEEFSHLTISPDAIDYIARASGTEIRQALNMLESLEILNGDVSLLDAQRVIGIKSMRIDDKEDSYYDLLSAFQKSIRGSDVDASLYYLGRLIKSEDLDIITRRILVIAYEDVGLANPQVGPRAYSACMTALHLGLPEARIPLAHIVIDLALSPKSNSAESAIDKALALIDSHPQYDIPRNILNREIKGESGLYKYPHDYDGGVVYQEYIPQEIRNETIYEEKNTGKYERALGEQNKKIKEILKK